MLRSLTPRHARAIGRHTTPHRQQDGEIAPMHRARWRTRSRAAPQAGRHDLFQRSFCRVAPRHTLIEAASGTPACTACVEDVTPASSRGGHFQRTTRQTYNTRAQSKVRSLANLAAASATCQPAAAARRSQAGWRAPPAGCRGAPAATAPPRPRPLAHARTRAAGRGVVCSGRRHARTCGNARACEVSSGR
jgi:hypothetical protein